MSPVSFLVDVFKGSMRAAARRTVVKAGTKFVLSGAQALAKGTAKEGSFVNDVVHSPHAETVLKTVAGVVVLNDDRFSNSNTAIELGSESLVQGVAGAQEALVKRLTSVFKR